MKNPIVSIIVPVHNRPALVSDAIRSVVLQTFQFWELIVVDDQSEDETWNVLELYAKTDKRIRVFRRDRLPKGAPTCRNIGAGLANGKFLFFLDSDDLITPWCLDERVNFLEKRPDLDIGLFQVLQLDIMKFGLTLRCDSTPGDNKKRLLSFKNGWSTENVFWRKESFEKLTGWDEQALSWQDGELHIRAIHSGLKYEWGSKIPDTLCRINSTSPSISKDNWLELKLFNRIETYQKIIPLLQSDEQELLKETFLKNLWGRSFFLKKKAIETLSIKSVNAGLMNNENKEEIIRFFNFYFFVGRIPFVRRIFYKKITKKIGQEGRILKIPFSEFEMDIFLKKFLELEQERAKKFICLLPQNYSTFFFTKINF